MKPNRNYGTKIICGVINIDFVFTTFDGLQLLLHEPTSERGLAGSCSSSTAAKRNAAEQI